MPSNAMLPTKISFMNEMAKSVRGFGADVNMVRHGIGSDSRIGYSYICWVWIWWLMFSKDVQALNRTAKEYGYEPKILRGSRKMLT